MHSNSPTSVDLALQGGGSHGAFTWGVLDRLLDEPHLRLDGVSGTSAGALNAAVLATGLAESGRAGAQAALRAFWMDVAQRGTCFGVWPHRPGSGLAGFNLDTNPLFAVGNQVLRAFSPAQFNPLGANPLRDVLQRHVRPQVLRDGPMSVYVTATEVRTGQPRVFDRNDLSIDALLASACLPQIFRPVEIDGEAYWDGGYSGNPAIWPLIHDSTAQDIVLVKINPQLRPDVPDTPEEIQDRVNEITFNAGLIAEMRAIDFVRQLIAHGHLERRDNMELRLHMVADDAGLAPLRASSKLNTDAEFLQTLHAMGRGAATKWLHAHGADLGLKSTLDMRAFLLPRKLRGRSRSGPLALA